MSDSENPAPRRLDFIREIIKQDLASQKHSHVVTRFPPEPNGYLHIGHAKALCLDFGAALEFPGDGRSRCHLRMDDTNPIKEDTEYVEAIQKDIRWLGFDWGDHIYFASDYYEKIYLCAVELIEKGLAYVEGLNAEEIREYRGNLTEAGRNSPDRDRSIEESLDLLTRMRAGEFEDGRYVLRAKIDMAHPNLNMRDPVLYRILHAHHHRTGDEWCLYPLYDFAHPISDALEGITHSLCSLEFEHHRPLYDWFVQQCTVPSVPRQIEFARLNLSYTIMSKRKLAQLVDEGHVLGWDDPRMPTLSGLRRRGCPPEAIRFFIDEVGLTKTNSLTDVALLDHHMRERLNATARRGMAVLRPLKLVITNLPEDHEEMLSGPVNPEDDSLGQRQIPFSRELWIEQEDFMEDPPRKFFRLRPQGEVRLINGYIVKCDEVVRNDGGEIIELRGTIDPETLGRHPADGRKVKGVIHWVSAAHAIEAEVRLYDRLFTEAEPEAGGAAFLDCLNADSLEVIPKARLEPSLAGCAPEAPVQFLRNGYFTPDSIDSAPGALVFNRTVGLRDSWAKLAAK